MESRLTFEAEPFEFYEAEHGPRGGAGHFQFPRARRGPLPAWVGEVPQPKPPSNVTPPQTVDADDAKSWVADIDAAIRRQFGLSGPGLAGRVRFVTSADFPKHLPASEVAAMLPNLFLERPDESPVKDILQFYRMSFGLYGSEEKYVKAWLARLRKFVAERIKAGYFEISTHAPPPPFQRLPFLSDALNKLFIKLRNMRETPTIRLTPRQLAAMMVGGFTTGQGNRADRRVIMPLPGPVDTLVHEACHFYAHPAFGAAARTRGANEIFLGLPVSEVLVEGFCEFFKRKVMQANQTVLGQLDVDAYQGHFKAAKAIVFSAGEPAAVKAYFKGDSAAINRLFAGIKATKENVFQWDRILP